MARDEAKILFRAETKEFNENLAKSAKQMSALKNEVKLSDAQMKSSGATVEALEKKHKLLTEQQEVAKQKTEQLSLKIEKAKALFGENSEEVYRLQKQLTNAKIEQANITNAINKCNEALEKQRAVENQVISETDKLTSSIDKQQAEVDRLKQEYVEAVLKFGDTSDEAKDLARQIDSLSGDLNENKRKMADAKSSADDFDRSLNSVDDAADNAEGGFTVMKGALADLVSEGIQLAIGKLNEFVDYMWSLPEQTREIRQDFATLDTAFKNVGLSSEVAKNTWTELYKVFGEDDRAVEAANNIARMAKSQKELDEWVVITTGVWGTYQDALPVEALAESAGETAKVGSVTGNLADALNWSSEAAVMFADYMSEDVVTAEDAFNEALKECNTEQERQELITETLTKLYGDAATEYNKTSGAMLDAKEATAENILVENDLANAIEPVTTKWQEMTTELKENLVPVAEKFSEWGIGALEWLEEHPLAMKVLAGVLGVVATAITTLTLVVTAYTIAQWAMNSAILANPITWIIVGIVAAIAAIVAIIIVVIEYWDQIVAAVKSAAESIKQALSSAWEWIKTTFSTFVTWIDTNIIQPVSSFFTNLWNSIVAGVQSAWTWVTTLLSTVGTWIYTNIIQPIVNYFTELWNSIVSTFHMVIDPWVEIIRRAAALFYETFIQPIIEYFTALFDEISLKIAQFKEAVYQWWQNFSEDMHNKFQAFVEKIKSFFTNLWNDIKAIWNTVSGWFSQHVTEPIVQKFTSIWTKLKEGAKNAWQGIKDTFSKVASFFGDIFSKAWTKVKDVFSTGGKIFDGIKDGIVSAFTTVVNAIIKGINKVIAVPFKGINSALSKIKSIEILGVKPFTWISTISTPQIPLLAEGGILTKPTLNIAGEAGPEAIIPIDKLQSFMNGTLERSLQRDNISQLVQAVEDLANRPVELIVNGQKFAVATAGNYDTVNGGRISLKQRGLAL